MSNCPHEFWERESSVASEGYCPICMASDLRKLRQELIEVNTTLQLYSIEIDRQKARAERLAGALRDCLLLAARDRKEEWAQHVIRFCESAGITSTILRDGEGKT